LLKLQAEARTKDKDRQKKKFQHDFDNDVQAQSVSSATSEILLRNRAIGGESSSDDEEHEGRPGDDDGIHKYFVIVNIVSLFLITNNEFLADEEDRVGQKSFHNFLEEQKKKQQSKSNKPS
jgi:hypothetical protein